MMQSPKMTLNLDIDSVNAILEALTELPYKRAYPIIQEIVRQSERNPNKDENIQ
jgi:hypothetical protein